MSKIVKIEEVNNVNFNDDNYPCYDGFRIETEDEEMYFLINNFQSCCENWGYISLYSRRFKGIYWC